MLKAQHPSLMSPDVALPSRLSDVLRLDLQRWVSHHKTARAIKYPQIDPPSFGMPRRPVQQLVASPRALAPSTGVPGVAL